ncbi:hypothetical protein Tco_0014821 [Tanacetum coccineum]
MPELIIFNKPQKGIFDEASYDVEGMVHDFNNLPTKVAISPIPTLRIHNIHPQSQILGDPMSSVQTRSKVQQNSRAHALISEALKDDSWVEAMQEELLQFRLQQLKKFDLASVKTAIDPNGDKKALTKDEEANEVDVHLYRSMIVTCWGKPWTENPQPVLFNFLGSGLNSWQMQETNNSGLPLQQKLKTSCLGKLAEDMYCGFQNQMLDMVSISHEYQNHT